MKHSDSLVSIPSPFDTGLRAVLFDLDGTLIDTEGFYDFLYAELLNSFGIQLTPALRHSLVGINFFLAAEKLAQVCDVAIDVTSTGQMLNTRTREYLSQRTPWRPGARELLNAVHGAGLPLALVTATHRETVDVVLPSLGAGLFSAVVCGDECVAYKPDPAPYLRATELLGLRPDSCLAIEDSHAGVSSALAAGCTVVAVPSVHPIEPGLGCVVRDSLLAIAVGELAEIHAGLRMTRHTSPRSDH